MKSLFLAAALSSFFVLPSRLAAADEGADAVSGDREAFLRTWASRSLARGRRSITLGPALGMGAGLGVDSGEFDTQLTVGLALLRYDIPVLPTAARLRDILESRFRAEVTRRIQAAIAGGAALTDDDKRRIARETWEAIRAELLLELQPRRWEKPSFAIRVDVGRLFEGEAWDLRAMFGVGVGPVFLSAGPSVRWADGAALVVPVELSKPMLLSGGLRSPVVDWFVRAELGATGRDQREDVILLGARLLLDVI